MGPKGSAGPPARRLEGSHSLSRFYNRPYRSVKPRSLSLVARWNPGCRQISPVKRPVKSTKD